MNLNILILVQTKKLVLSLNDILASVLTRKRLINLFCFLAFSQVAIANEFQQFDNQIGIGYNYNYIHAYNSEDNEIAINTQSNNLNVNVEQLFNNNAWININGNFAFYAKQNTTMGFSREIQEIGFPASLAGKFGYSINSSVTHLQLIPYVTVGRLLNYNGISIINNGFSKSYLNLYGGGARAEYIMTPKSSIYFDQSVGYLQDPNAGVMNQNAMSYTSLLGVRYNVTPSFQLGLQGSFNYVGLLNNDLAWNPIEHVHQNNSQSSYGGMLNFAYLYDNDRQLSFETTNNNKAELINFDNNYNLGYGYANSTNSYKGGNNPSINSNVDYFAASTTHLFQNNVWANINAELLNNIKQTNIQSGQVNAATPTYLGFPGSVVGNIGYGFQNTEKNAQIIPYANAGIVMNINSYDLRTNTSMMSAISHDMYLQYGLGARGEYVVNKYWQVYADELVAQMQDRSTLSNNAFRSTTSLGIKVNPYSQLQIGVKGFYDTINPEGNTYNNNTKGYMALQQNSFGGLLDVGFHY